MTAATPHLYTFQIPDAEFVVCDVETTGLSPERNRLTEVALVRVVDGKIVESFESLINPRQFVPREITALTGITNAMVLNAPDAAEVLPQVKRFIGEAVFVAHNVRFDRSFVDATLHRVSAEPLASPNLCTARLARRLLPNLARKSLGSIGAHLGIHNPRKHRAANDAAVTAQVLIHFLRVLQEEFELTEVAELLSFQNRPVFRVSGVPKHISRVKPYLDALPSSPGVYHFHDKQGYIIYVGKAKDLRDRVLSYFYYNIGHTEKVQRLVKAVHSITWKETETELSALLAESRAIKQHQPRFNTLLKNYRMYPFLRLDMRDEYPTLGWSYDIADDGAEYYGPFSSRFSVERVLDTIAKTFLLRECDGRLRPSIDEAPCLYHDIKRCGAPCALLQSRDEYLREVQTVVDFLGGRIGHIQEGMRQRMEMKAEALDFEGAAVIRDRLAAVERIIRQQQVMVRSIRAQNLVIITLARRTNVEVHLIRAGMLTRQIMIDQRNVAKSTLREHLELVFFTRQTELFQGRKEDIDEMRIIASWCLRRSDDSVAVEVDDACTLDVLCRRVLQRIQEAGKREAAEETTNAA
jgi:DNA polymerase III subunit epsilon